MDKFDASDFDEKEPILGILGGVGPMAGIMLHKQIVLNTKADLDQDHLSIVHMSLSKEIDDRTDYLLKKDENDSIEVVNPGLEMAKIATNLAKSAELFDKQCIVGIPCNTFHAKSIYSVFKEEIKNISNIKVLNMISLTIKYVKDKGYKRVGLLCTTGTRDSKLFNEKCNKFGLELVEVGLEEQEIVMDLIYNKDFGIKSLSYANKHVKETFKGFIEWFKEQGVYTIILGCSEIPLVFDDDTLIVNSVDTMDTNIKQVEHVELVDPVEILAKQMIEEADPNKLK